MRDRAPFVDAKPRRAAAPAFSMRKLERLALWGSAAAAAMFVAVIAARSDVGAQRIAGFLPLIHPPSSRAANPMEAAAAPLDTEAATRELVQAVRSLTEDRDRLMARLAAIEHKLDDVTGSLTQEMEAARTPPPWPDKAPPVPATPVTIASVVTPVVPPTAGLASPAPPMPPGQIAGQVAGQIADATSTAAPPVYGVDLGGARSVQVLHERWEAFRAARPKLFEGLKPLVGRKDAAPSKRGELRLLVGPFPDIAAAARLCASLAAVWPFCEPTTFEG